MPTDATEIDTAILARLNGDAALLGLLTDRVWFDEAPASAERFGIVSLMSALDVQQFGRRSHEDAIYLVKSVVLSTVDPAGAVSTAAAARIDALLDGQAINPTGYTPMATFREERIRYTEVDDVDPSIRWQHRGGRYRVVVSL